MPYAASFLYPSGPVADPTRTLRDLGFAFLTDIPSCNVTNNAPEVALLPNMGDGSNLPFQEYAASVQDKVSLKLATDERVRSVSWFVSNKNERIVCRRAEKRKPWGQSKLGQLPNFKLDSK